MYLIQNLEQIRLNFLIIFVYIIFPKSFHRLTHSLVNIRQKSYGIFGFTFKPGFSRSNVILTVIC